MLNRLWDLLLWHYGQVAGFKENYLRTKKCFRSGLPGKCCSSEVTEDRQFLEISFKSTLYSIRNNKTVDSFIYHPNLSIFGIFECEKSTLRVRDTFLALEKEWYETETFWTFFHKFLRVRPLEVVVFNLRWMVLPTLFVHLRIKFSFFSQLISYTRIFLPKIISSSTHLCQWDQSRKSEEITFLSCLTPKKKLDRRLWLSYEYKFFVLSSWFCSSLFVIYTKKGGFVYVRCITSLQIQHLPVYIVDRWHRSESFPGFYFEYFYGCLKYSETFRINGKSKTLRSGTCTQDRIGSEKIFAEKSKKTTLFGATVSNQVHFL